MNSALTDAIKEAFAVCPTNKVIYHTLEIRQDGVQGPQFIVNSRRAVSARDEDGNMQFFEAIGFEFSLPPANEEGFRDLSVAIDNTNRRVSDYIETALTENVPVKLIYRPYLSDNLDAPQWNPPLVMYLRDVQINHLQVSGKATFMNVVNKAFPSELYIRDRFPTLG
ncbi:MAG: hypothetical protein Unbinned3891contig1000_2 [Prokaryotic dsDNA virus sp.]|nr:MAG: hypothetical protein Unbinned3891contig1000_2 [Prokaryotic dsDNA virus sp.]|tara:strand:- start:28033 stop:28533 length:501 start_codon:yes stop_codon:yes gene_type:complete